MGKKQANKKRLNPLDLYFHLPIEGPGRDDMRQLYSWTFEDAWKAHEEWEIKYGPNIVGRGPFFRWVGAQELKELYDLYQTKKNGAILEALHICSLNSLPIPRWCEMAYLAAYRKVRQYKAKSWDDVFGRPHPKNMKIDAKRDEREKGFKIYHHAKKALENDPSIAVDRSFFGKIGKDFGVGDSLAEKYYYEWKKRLNK